MLEWLLLYAQEKHESRIKQELPFTKHYAWDQGESLYFHISLCKRIPLIYEYHKLYFLQKIWDKLVCQ